MPPRKRESDDMETKTMTPEQQSVFNRVRAESAEWETIGEESMVDYSLAIHPLNLKDNFPEAYKEEVEKRYAFRWCTRDDKSIDERTRGGHPVTRWKICTRTTAPFLEKYVDPILGCVTRLDQILLFRPWDRHMVEKRAKEGYAETRANSGNPENRLQTQEGVEVSSGPQYRLGSNDEVAYTDTRDENEEY